MNKQSLLAVVLVIACAGPGLALAQGSDDRSRVRLILTNGETMDVLGPVVRQDGLVVFYTEDGMRTSVRERLVRQVQELDATRENGSDGTPRRSAPAARAQSEFTNQHLPVTATPPGAEPAAPVPLRSRPTDPGAFGNDDLPGSAAAPTDEPPPPAPQRAPTGALTNENLPPAPEAAPDAPVEPTRLPAPPRPGALTNENLPGRSEAPSAEPTPQPPLPAPAPPRPGALTNADLPAPPANAPEQPAPATPTSPRTGAFSNQDLPQAEPGAGTAPETAPGKDNGADSAEQAETPEKRTESEGD